MPVVTLPSFTAFAAYLGSGVLVWILALVCYALVTRHSEFAQIRKGNAAAAIAFAGAAIGMALPISSAITHSVSLLDSVVWGALAVVFQLVAYGASHLFVPKISTRIDAGDLAAGVFLAGSSVAIGLMNAAAMTP
ncbi:MAG: DUF350 domain-containing protein [Lysobacter sp.]|nr:DUF350 domain-containing protein [Lysobacter sp.]